MPTTAAARHVLSVIAVETSGSTQGVAAAPATSPANSPSAENSPARRPALSATNSKAMITISTTSVMVMVPSSRVVDRDRAADAVTIEIVGIAATDPGRRSRRFARTRW